MKYNEFADRKFHNQERNFHSKTNLQLNLHKIIERDLKPMDPLSFTEGTINENKRFKEST